MPSRITILSFFLLGAIICASIPACSRSKQQEQPRLQFEQQPKISALPPTPAPGPPELRPPQPTEALETIKRVYGDTVFVESSRPKYFVAGEFNEDAILRAAFDGVHVLRRSRRPPLPRPAARREGQRRAALLQPVMPRTV